MAFDPLKLARPEIANIVPYVSNRQPNACGDGYMYLDANESTTDGVGINRYPDTPPKKLYERLANLYDVDAKNLLVTRGSDDAIDCLIRTFCAAGIDAIVIQPPTFPMYKIAAQIQGASCIEVPLNSNLTLNFNELQEALNVNNNVKLVFLCSPQNPVGSSLPRDKICEIINANETVLFVVDEAYQEFSQTKTMVDMLPTLPNLVVLRTLSKAYGLAGARIGTIIASADLINLVFRVLPPFLLPTPSVTAALMALSPATLAKRGLEIANITSEREKMRLSLGKLDNVVRIYPSEANFLLCEFKNAAATYKTLQKNGILVRKFADQLQNHLRISVGTSVENNLLLSALGVGSNIKPPRQAEVERTTKETSIYAAVNLDASSPININTGISFFDHMLEQLSKHSGIAMTLLVKGDIEVDAHHTVEDCMIALGEAVRLALGNKRGIERYGFSLPMDEARADVLIDLSGRGICQFNCDFTVPMLGQLPTEMISHAINSFAESLKAAIHVDISGENNHHKAEAVFKGLAKALKAATKVEGNTLPSTKGML